MPVIFFNFSSAAARFCRNPSSISMATKIRISVSKESRQASLQRLAEEIQGGGGGLVFN
jgi:hypothetical protein